MHVKTLRQFAVFWLWIWHLVVIKEKQSGWILLIHCLFVVSTEKWTCRYVIESYWCLSIVFPNVECICCLRMHLQLNFLVLQCIGWFLKILLVKISWRDDGSILSNNWGDINYIGKYDFANRLNSCPHVLCSVERISMGWHCWGCWWRDDAPSWYLKD